MPAPSGFPLREAWPGPTNAGDGVHLVDWPAGQDHGSALCGRQIAQRWLYPTGTSRRAGTRLCGRCTAAVEARRPSAPVVSLDERRRR
jgi:hypothetical protein